MDKTQLKNFVALAQTLNFSSVARQQFISQPALTNQISKLEGELGVRLFQRSKHGVSLTYAGSEFYKHASGILDAMERAERHMEDIGRGQSGFLNISTVSSNEYQVVKYVREFNRRYSGISINMDEGTGTQQIMAINRKSFDLYFSFSSLLKATGCLEVLDLEPSRYAIYISSELAGNISPQRLDGLRGLNELIESRSEGPFLAAQSGALSEKLGLTENRVMYFPSSDSVLMAVQSGLGYALLPSTMNLGALPQDIEVIPIPGDDALIHNAVGWHKGSCNIAVEKFTDMLRELI